MFVIDAAAVVLLFPLCELIGVELAAILFLFVVIASPAIAERIP